MSKWKAGQCVTIKGKKYRIVKMNNTLFVNCLHCSLFDADLCGSLCEKPTAKVPDDCYFKEIKPKS
jgi:hypothetical protein